MLCQLKYWFFVFLQGWKFSLQNINTFLDKLFCVFCITFCEDCPISKARNHFVECQSIIAVLLISSPRRLLCLDVFLAQPWKANVHGRLPKLRVLVGIYVPVSSKGDDDCFCGTLILGTGR